MIVDILRGSGETATASLETTETLMNGGVYKTLTTLMWDIYDTTDPERRI